MSESRSPELRRHLAGSLDPDVLDSEYRFNRKYAGYDERFRHLKGRELDLKLEQLRTEYEKECEALQLQIADLQKSAEFMEEEQFNEEYSSLFERIESFIQDSRFTLTYVESTVRSFSSPEKKVHHYDVDFCPIRDVKDSREFGEKRPMLWKPRSEDICRILFIAKQLHDQRVKKGEIHSGDPIIINDMGGGNGALGALIMDAAKENGLEVVYNVIDPNNDVLRQAQEEYGDEMTFDLNTAEDRLNSQLHSEGFPKIAQQVNDVRNYSKSIDQKFADLQRLEHSIDNADPLLFNEIKREVCKILEVDFLLPTEEIIKADNRFQLYQKYKDLKLIWLEKQRQQIIGMREKIEISLSKLKRTSDLVINSWMPNQIDFTPEIRMLRSAGILYMTSGCGDTGIQDTSFEAPGIRRRPTAIESNVIPKPSSEYSYSPGMHYAFANGWVGPLYKDMSTSFYEDDPSAKQSEFKIERVPNSNYFVFQTAQGYEAPDPKDISRHEGISIEKEYQWTQGLDYSEAKAVDPISLPHVQDYRDIRTRLQLYSERLENDVVEDYPRSDTDSIDQNVIDRSSTRDSFALTQKSEHVDSGESIEPFPNVAIHDKPSFLKKLLRIFFK